MIKPSKLDSAQPTSTDSHIIMQMCVGASHTAPGRTGRTGMQETAQFPEGDHPQGSSGLQTANKVENLAFILHFNTDKQSKADVYQLQESSSSSFGNG